MPIALRSADASFAGTSSNIGVGGIFVRTERRLAVGDRVTLEFKLPDHIHPTSVEAEVRWISEEEQQAAGVGLRFVNPSIGATVALHDLLRRIDEDRTPSSRSA